MTTVGGERWAETPVGGRRTVGGGQRRQSCELRFAVGESSESRALGSASNPPLSPFRGPDVQVRHTRDGATVARRR